MDVLDTTRQEVHHGHRCSDHDDLLLRVHPSQEQCREPGFQLLDRLLPQCVLCMFGAEYHITSRIGLTRSRALCTQYVWRKATTLAERR